MLGQWACCLEAMLCTAGAGGQLSGWSSLRPAWSRLLLVPPLVRSTSGVTRQGLWLEDLLHKDAQSSHSF